MSAMTSSRSAPLTRLEVTRQAWPIILANAAVPALGLVDTAVIGHFGTATDLGGLALGALAFNFVYWSFGFLRMGTTGFVAQAAGAGDEAEVRASMGRAVLMAAVLGAVLVAVQWPVMWLYLGLMDGSEAVESVTAEYFQARIWGAPAALTLFACSGLLIGLGRSRELLFVQLLLNGLNAGLDIWFAGHLGMGARGIGVGTAIAEWSTCAVALAVGILLLGQPAVSALTTLDGVREVAFAHLPWAALYVLVSVAAFQLDGVFIGATRTREMRNAGVLSLATFLLVAWPLTAAWGNHGLWAAFVVYVIARAGALWPYYRRMEREITPL